MSRTVLRAAAVFDGQRLRTDVAVAIDGDRIGALLPAADATAPGETLSGGILAPGFVDLQVNGGGGVLLSDAPSVEAIAAICAAHAGRGTTGLLPTLVSATPAITEAAIAAGIAAAEARVPGFLGLHLEGPHLDPRRAGAHDPDLLRAMEAGDVARLVRAAARLPALVVTIAPEQATPAQIAALAEAGVLVSLGHSGCTAAAAHAAFAAGARMVTHLFNAMSPLGHREPGLVGAALDDARAAAGLIADGIHVAPEVMRIALAAKRGPGRIVLVSDAMAVAGTNARHFMLGGRAVERRGGRLTLADGTLAGADLDMAAAVRTLVEQVGLAPEQALAMATRYPAALAGQGDQRGRITPGCVADLVHLSDDLDPLRVWQGGREVAVTPPGTPG